MNTSTMLLHIALNADLENYQSAGHYRCESLSIEGFIHCCHQNQLAGVVNRYYQGVDHLSLLLIDPELLDSAVVLENTVGGSELFPHIYGPINVQAIQQVLPFGLSSTERHGLME